MPLAVVLSALCFHCAPIADRQRHLPRFDIVRLPLSALWLAWPALALIAALLVGACVFVPQTLPLKWGSFPEPSCEQSMKLLRGRRGFMLPFAAHTPWDRSLFLWTVGVSLLLLFCSLTLCVLFVVFVCRLLCCCGCAHAAGAASGVVDCVCGRVGCCAAGSCGHCCCNRYGSGLFAIAFTIFDVVVCYCGMVLSGLIGFFFIRLRLGLIIGAAIGLLVVYFLFSLYASTTSFPFPLHSSCFLFS